MITQEHSPFARLV